MLCAFCSVRVIVSAEPLGNPTVSVYYAREKRRNCGALNASALRSPQAAPLQRYLSSPVTARDRRFQTTQAAMQMT